MLRGVARAKKESRIWAWYSRRSGNMLDVTLCIAGMRVGGEGVRIGLGLG